MTTNLTQVDKCIIWEDSAPFLMGRIKLADNTDAQQADITTIKYTVSERRTGQHVVSNSLVVADVIFDTLQNSDTRWTKDSDGYNFAFPLPITALPENDVEYVVTVIFNPVSGADFSSQYRIETAKVYYGVPTHIDMIAGDTYTEVIKGLSDLTNWSKIWFVVKENKYDLDSESLVNIEKTVGLQVLEGSSSGLTAGDGVIAVDNEPLGEITVTLKGTSSISLDPKRNTTFAIKVLYTDNTVATIARGNCEIKQSFIEAVS